MRHGLAVLLAICLFPAAIRANDTPVPERGQLLAKAITALTERRLVESLQLSETIIAAFEADYAKSDKQIFCADTGEKAIAITLRAAAQNKNAAALDITWCTALFMKGFILIELNRAAEAKPFLARAVEMAPLDAHFLNEYAEWYKTARQWQDAYDWFEKARDASQYSSETVRNSQKARSLRGMGFAMIELGDLDKASNLFKDSLKFMPDNPAALSELKYIEDLRRAQK